MAQTLEKVGSPSARSRAQRWFPFVDWFPMSPVQVRADLLAGITVALVLIPQSMAYAQLAGLPVVYGLYASFAPVIVAALWGSSPQLHTGPVAMLSLMSAAALIPLAAPGSPTFIELSILLALFVGVLRLALGLGRLGILVNLVSNPVLVGFTNAAALIIGLSLLNQVIGVPMPRSDSYLADLWEVVAQVPQAHLPTLAFALAAWALIRVLGRFTPRWPAVLIAVVVATAVSAGIGFERKLEVSSSAVADAGTVGLIETYQQTAARIDELTATIAQKGTELRARRQRGEDAAQQVLSTRLEGETEALRVQAEYLKLDNNRRRVQLHAIILQRVEDGGAGVFYREGALPPGAATDGRAWRFAGVKGERIVLSAGGAVVGDIPRGLPAFDPPAIRWDALPLLLPAAFVMALIGLMEATSISKAIAAKTRQRVDVNKELVGQGLANIAGSFFSAYTVSGSFSRSAVAARSGARTGLFAIVSALAVVAVLLFLTPFLYHLPQAVLAVVVMTAVFGLIRVQPLVHAWRVERIGALIGVATFAATLAMAPAIANGILLGIGLTVTVFIVKRMKPRAEILGQHPDGGLAGMDTHGLQPISEQFVPVRFDGALTFVNVTHFEDVVLEALARFSNAKAILVIGSSINEIDVSGEEKIRSLAERLAQVGVTLYLCGLKKQVLDVLGRAHLSEVIPPERIFRTKEQALRALMERYGGGLADRRANAVTGL